MTEFNKIGVVGAGMMGSEIALMFALSGYPTLLGDQSPDAAKRAIERLHGVLDRGLPRGFWSEAAAETARRQLSVADGLEAYEGCGFVIEAVFENEDLKRDVFRKLDAILAPGAGLASNTSSISITSLSAALAEPRRARFVGTHFFSPVSRMRLVEVIPTLDTDPAFVDAVEKTMVAIGKAPIRVKDVVGFAVNRLLHALVIEFDPARRGRRLFACGDRYGLQARPWPPDRTVRTPGQHAELAFSQRSRNSSSGLWRAFSAASAAPPTRRSRLQWPQGGARLAPL